MRIQLLHDQDPECGLVAFAEVVTRDPFFIIGGEPRPGFALGDLADVALATVSEVPTPWLCLQEDLRRAGHDPDSIPRISDRSMAENAAALSAGEIDAIQVFEPFVEELIGQAGAHIWYAAARRGPTSYTTLYTSRRNLAAKREIMLAMTKALQRTLSWIHVSDAAAIADTIGDYFPDLEPALLAACIERYKGLELWGRNPILPRDGFERLKASCLSGGLIAKGAAYEACVDTTLAREVAGQDFPALK